MSSPQEQWRTWFCNNPDCSAFGDNTPTSDPNSDKCLMCNEPHVWVTLERPVSWKEIRTIVRAAVLG